MKDATLEDITYPVQDLLPVFDQGPFPELLGHLNILTAEPEPQEVRSLARVAILSADEPNFIKLKIRPEGFTKQDFLDLRDRVQVLENGTEVTIAGNPHVVAIFSSCMIVDDHEVQEVTFTFEIDPFARRELNISCA